MKLPLNQCRTWGVPSPLLAVTIVAGLVGTMWGGILLFYPLLEGEALLWYELHGTLEAINIVLALTLCLMVLNSRQELSNYARITFSVAFLVVALLRLGHVVTYPVLQDGLSLYARFAENPVNLEEIQKISLFLAVSSEFVLATAFLLRACTPLNPPIIPLTKELSLLIAVLTSILVWQASWYYLPSFEFSNRLMEWGALFLALAIPLLAYRAWRSKLEGWAWLACAAWVFLLSALCMIFSAGEIEMLFWGHIFSTIGFILTYRTIYLHVVEDPMKSLQQVRDQLAEQALRYRTIFEASKMPMLLIDPENHGQIVNANHAAFLFYKYSFEEITQLKISDINQLSPSEVAQEMQRAKQERRSHFQFPHKLSCGAIRQVEVYSGPIELDGKTLLFSIIHDITHQKQLEAQRIQGHRLEAIGQITGGVAHDFNNLLQVVVGNLELLRDLEPDQQECVSAALEAAIEGGELTHRLLAYARHQALQRRHVNVNELIRQFIKRLEPTFPDDIAFIVSLHEGLPTLEIDPIQLETALLNITVNARDAMPNVGMLYFVTKLSGEPVNFLRIIIQDTGIGMDQHTLEHATEPFFTTKSLGQGTGLGLSAAYGFVKQSGGELYIDSAPNLGTTVIIDLPLHRTSEDGLTPPQRISSSSPPRSRKISSILVVEDNHAVRQSAVRSLKHAGYKTYQVPHGQAALNYLIQGLEADVVLSDVAMPGTITGLDLKNWLQKYRPEVRVILMTGITESLEGIEVPLLQKPFTPAQLVKLIESTLESQHYDLS